MWWWFEKLKENDEVVLYAYSRESRLADGRIEINKKTKISRMILPCAVDKDNTAIQEASRMKGYTIIRRHYPDREQIACG